MVAAPDKTFVMNAAEGGMMEVQLGQLAASKAENADVKKFGQRMVDDHTKANNDLKKVAADKQITVPSDLNAKAKAEMKKLEAMNGAAFDRAYMSMMVSDHRKDVSEFQKASNTAKDSEIKTFASNTLPTLQDHLKEAERVNTEIRTTAKK